MSIIMAIGRTYDMRWILVGDASQAKLYEQRPGNQELTLLHTFSHDESRAKVGDIMSDAQGRKPLGTARGRGSVKAPGSGVGSVYLGRPGAEPHTDPKAVEAERFARELTQVLTDGLNQHAYENLVLVAPPQFLGLMRANIPKTVEKRIAGTIDKDLAWFEPRDLEQRLHDMIS